MEFVVLKFSHCGSSFTLIWTLVTAEAQFFKYLLDFQVLPSLHSQTWSLTPGSDRKFCKVPSPLVDEHYVDMVPKSVPEELHISGNA